jgi:hypothetical protein
MGRGLSEANSTLEGLLRTLSVLSGFGYSTLKESEWTLTALLPKPVWL